MSGSASGSPGTHSTVSASSLAAPATRPHPGSAGRTQNVKSPTRRIPNLRKPGADRGFGAV